MPEITELGIGAIFSLMILKEVFGYLKSRKDDSPVLKLPETVQNSLAALVIQMDQMHEMKDDIKKSISQTDELYKMHNVKDLNGVPVWYVNQSLGIAIERLAENVQNQSIVLERIAERLLKNDNDHSRIEVKMDKVLTSVTQ